MYVWIIFILTVFIVTSLSTIPLLRKSKPITKKQLKRLNVAINNRNTLAFELLMYEILIIRNKDKVFNQLPNLREDLIKLEFHEALSILDNLD